MWFAFTAALGLALSNASTQANSLEATLRQVDAAYPKLVALRQDVNSAEAKAREKRGAFDPTFSVTSDFLHYNSSSSPGSAYDSRQNEAAVEFTTPDGAKVAIGSRLNQGKVKSPLSATGDLGELFVSLKVPLIRNWGVNDKSVSQKQAEQSIELAKLNLAAYRLNVLSAAGGVYWDFAAAIEKRTIAQELFRLAEVRAQGLEDRYKAGDIPEIDHVEAQTEVKRRRGSFVKAERDVQKASLKLGLYLGSSPQIPPTSLSTIKPEESLFDAVQAKQEALKKRPEVSALVPARVTLDLSLKLAYNERKPNLDLTFGPGYDAGTGGIGGTLKLGLVYSGYLRQNTADGRIDDARAKIKKFEAEADLLRQTVATEVEDALSAVSTTSERVVVAQEEFVLAKRLEQGERDRFDLGEGTLFLLNQRERSTAEAASRWIDTLAEYQQAKLALQAAMGVL